MYPLRLREWFVRSNLFMILGCLWESMRMDFLFDHSLFGSWSPKEHKIYSFSWLDIALIFKWKAAHSLGYAQICGLWLVLGMCKLNSSLVFLWTENCCLYAPEKTSIERCQWNQADSQSRIHKDVFKYHFLIISSFLEIHKALHTIK